MPEATEQQYIKKLRALLSAKGISLEASGASITCSSGKKKFVLPLAPSPDRLFDQPQKLAALIQSKLQLNQRVFARQCEVKKIEKPEAERFLDSYHLMNSTNSASNFGLFYQGELLAVASFSKGRKMNRLTEDKRSYELIRFCCKDGISVSGGLTKLVKNFCREKEAGDVMTYVDRQLSEGASFIRAGFVKHGETDRNIKLVYTP